MEGFTIEVKRRTESGKGALNRYRRQGLIPAVIYQHGFNPVSGIMDYDKFIHVGERAKTSQVLHLKSDDKDLDGRIALVREVQRDYVKGSILHVDFQALRDDEAIKVEVVLVFKGEAVGVKVDGGILTVVVHHIAVSCLPKDIPTEIEVDVSELHVGSSIHAGQLALPKGVSLVSLPEEPLVSVIMPKAVVEEVKAPEEGAIVPAEGEAAEGAVAAPTAAGAAATAAKGPEKAPEKEKEKKEKEKKGKE